MIVVANGDKKIWASGPYAAFAEGFLGYLETINAVGIRDAVQDKLREAVGGDVDRVWAEGGERAVTIRLTPSQYVRLLEARDQGYVALCGEVPE